MRHHTIITGTGRSGTTFLVQLLTELGLDTGFTDTAAGVNEISRAGLERDIRDEGAPYIVKSPHLTHRLSDVLATGELVIDHAIVPMRDLFSAAESRRFVEACPERASLGEVAPGGLWGTGEPVEQEDYLAHQVYALMRTLAVHAIPLILLDFPRLALDADYLFEHLSPVIPDVSQNTFYKAFDATSRPELIHRFATDSVEHHKRAERLAVAHAQPRPALVRRIAELEERIGDLQAAQQKMLQERKVLKHRQDVQKVRVASLERRMTRQGEVLTIRNRQLARANKNLERLQERLRRSQSGFSDSRSVADSDR